MARFLDILMKFKEQKTTISIYRPGNGFILATIHGISDDTITVKPEGGDPKFVLHASNVVFERN